MILGGLDIATTTGAAVKKNGEITTETIRLPSKKKSILDKDDKKNLDGDEAGDLLIHFEVAIRSWIIRHGIQEVAIEEPLRTDFQRTKTVVDTQSEFAGNALRKETVAGTPMKTVFRIYSLVGVACKVCRQMNVNVRFVNQTTWRRDFLGNGRPKDPKHEARKMCEQLGIKISSLDSAEAAGIVSWLDNQLNPYAARGGLFGGPSRFAKMSAREAAESIFRK